MRKIVFDIETSAYPFESHPLDTSAAAIVASAAIELYQFTKDEKYLNAAKNMQHSTRDLAFPRKLPYRPQDNTRHHHQIHRHPTVHGFYPRPPTSSCRYRSSPNSSSPVYI